MLQTFKANLKGNQLEWLDDQPTSMPDKPRTVYVVLLEESPANKPKQPQIYQPNDTTLTALKEIETGGGKVFESVEKLFKDCSETELALVRTGSHSELF